MKFCNILLVAAILGGLFFAGCLSEGAGSDLPEIKKDFVIPEIRLLSPVGGETLSGVVEIQWLINDTSSPVKVDLYYTTDPKPFCPTCPPQEWHEIATGKPDDGVYEWDTSDYPPSNLYMIKIKLITTSGAVENATVDAFTIK